MKLLDEEKQRWYCYKDDEVYFAKEQRWAGHEAVVPAVQKPPAPPVGELDVWVPIVWLVGTIFLGFFSWVLGLFGLIGATIYVYYDAKKFGIGASRAALTFLFAIIGLPLYAYDLHKLRKAQQTGQLGTSVEPTTPATTPSVAQEASATSPPTNFCRNCGAEITRDSTYCEECGNRLV
jgi:hypothetical protein